MNAPRRDPTFDGRRLVELAKQVDWPKALQRGGAFLRALRGDTDADVHADSSRELERSRQLHALIKGAARRAIGCIAPKDCYCAICQEERSHKP